MNTYDILRLDRNKPPQGYNVGWSTHGASEWSFTSPAGARFPRPASGIDDLAGFASEAEAIAATWTHHQERNDPPGLSVGYEVSSDGKRQTWGFFVGDSMVWRARGLASREAARAAAWTWYWRRVIIVNRMEGPMETPCGCGRGMPGAVICVHVRKRLAGLAADAWPRALSWSDEVCASVELWLDTPARDAPLPTVFRC